MPNAQFNNLFESVKALQELVTVMQESNSRLISSICRIQSLVQEELQLDSTALDDAKIEEVSVEDTRDGAGIVGVGDSDSDLIAENSGLLDNSKVPPEMLENPVAD